MPLIDGLLYLVEPVINFGDELFVTDQEGQELTIYQTQADTGMINAGANQTLADAQLTAAQDAATFTEDEQRQLGIIILSVIGIIFIVGIFYTLNKTE